ncbi:MAG: L-threonylcarbamoyladenylate synthase [Candidatus Komeilibacteria bacterium]
MFDQQHIGELQNGQIGIIPTDTLYGIVGLALNADVVERIYELKQRDGDKPFIILISEIVDLKKFNIQLSDEQQKYLENVWPGALSIILSCPGDEFKYLHRGKRSLAFRLPKNEELRGLLKQTGPLVAPSANLQDQPPAYTIQQAKEYFGDRVNFYLDIGVLRVEPSTLVDLTGDRPKMLRQGVVKLVS